MLFLFITVVAFFGCSSAQTLADCPAGLERNENLQVHGDACFEFILEYVLDYNSANADCKLHGGTLALVKTKDISDYIIDQLVYEFGDARSVWIGLNDKGVEGTYEWEDGTPLGDYKNWAPSTNGTSNLKDCTYFDPSKNGQWHEDNCSDLLWGLFEYERPYICQYKTRAGTATPASA